jgi:hypothetical protein
MTADLARRFLPYRALHHPPTCRPPEFIQGITDSPRLVFCTTTCLLTEHAFTGEYTMRHCPRASDPHGCPCGIPTPTRPAEETGLPARGSPLGTPGLNSPAPHALDNLTHI